MAHDRVRDGEAVRQHLLVLRCQAGDERAFSELYDLFNRRTLRYLQGLLDKQAAEDVQQEVWVTVFRKIAMLANPSRFRTWLYQVTRHRAIDFLRRETRQSDLGRWCVLQTYEKPPTQARIEEFWKCRNAFPSS